MIQIRNTRERRVLLVLRLCDIMTGDTIKSSRDITVTSGDGLAFPVVKPEGYFVFVDYLPESIIVKSAAYYDAEITTEDYTGGVFRMALIPRSAAKRTITVLKNSHTGFGGKSYGYTLAASLTETAGEIYLQKEDYRDITDMYHVLITPEGGAETVYLEKNLGGGRYILQRPPERMYPVRGTRLIALYRTAGGLIPVPPDADKAYIMHEGKVNIESFEVL